MTWSTREIAELAGTSLRAVRYYHEVGLLDEPARGANGYKRYGVAHLVRLLRITRLTDLGLPASRIADLGEIGERPEEALRIVDAELAATIEHLQRARAEIALRLRQRSPIDLPPEMAPAVTGLSDADRAFVVVLTRILNPTALAAFREMLPSLHDDPAVGEFDRLPADADAEAVRSLTERLLPHVRDIRDSHPGMRDTGPGARHGARFVNRTMGLAIADLYNPAQRDVLVHLDRALSRSSARGATS
ncbi:MerR family transcriptional regulator [Actinophytocola oryzae]|uniref:DNA-binding transcriptional MerR regulator n=1 Tax=Actinophytocola oryzae TaxID=502181 RepID=A0A4V3FUS7_9PSEU|nr:MerR family transcriptional regulator [Actinophytocola oryzae]TDV56391.1 DNA-binding transcriptional MerR regulator [Actinophytocola oryzae]